MRLFLFPRLGIPMASQKNREPTGFERSSYYTLCSCSEVLRNLHLFGELKIKRWETVSFMLGVPAMQVWTPMNGSNRMQWAKSSCLWSHLPSIRTDEGTLMSCHGIMFTYVYLSGIVIIAVFWCMWLLVYLCGLVFFPGNIVLICRINARLASSGCSSTHAPTLGLAGCRVFAWSFGRGGEGYGVGRNKNSFL